LHHVGFEVINLSSQLNNRKYGERGAREVCQLKGISILGWIKKRQFKVPFESPYPLYFDCTLSPINWFNPQIDWNDVKINIFPYLKLGHYSFSLKIGIKIIFKMLPFIKVLNWTWSDIFSNMIF